MERVDTPTEMDVDVVVGEAEMEVPAEEEVVAADGAADDPFEFDIHIKIECPNVPLTTLRVNEETTVGAVMKTLVKRGNIPPDTHVMIFRARVITDEYKTMSTIGLQPDANATVAPRALFSSQWALQPTPATTPSADAAPADAPPLAAMDDSFVAQSPFAGLTPGYSPGGLTAGFTGQGPFVDSSATPGTPGQPGTPGGP